MIVGARLQCPLVVGIGDGEMFLASSIAAFLRETRRVQLIEDGEVVAITTDGARFVSVDDGPRERDEFEVDWDDEAAEKHGYETFMLKEIYEQPQAVAETIGERVRGTQLALRRHRADGARDRRTSAAWSSSRREPPITRGSSAGT